MINNTFVLSSESFKDKSKDANVELFASSEFVVVAHDKVLPVTLL